MAVLDENGLARLWSKFESNLNSALSNYFGVKADASTSNIKTYTSPTQFGSTVSATATDMLAAVPDNSIFICNASDLTDASWNFPKNKATLEYIRYNNQRAKLLLWGKNQNHNNYIGILDNNGNHTGEWITILTTVLQDGMYGDTLPDAGTAGRVFFKKVSS